MKKKTFNIKDQTANKFLKKYAYWEQDASSTSAYHLMRDELMLFNDGPLKAGQTVIIELMDKSEGSGVKLKNTYTYKVEKYDDVAIKLTLQDFKIEVIQEAELSFTWSNK